MASDPRDKRARAQRSDPFIGLRTDMHRADVRCLRQLGDPRRELALEAGLLRVTFAIAEEGMPLPDDERVAALAVGMSIPTWRSIRGGLEKLELIWPTAGGWMTAAGERELDRREKRRSSDNAPSGERTQKRKNGNKNKGRVLPLPIPHTQTPEESSTLLTPQGDRSSEIQKLASQGTGKGGAVSPEARRKVAARLGLVTVDPLVRLYEAWPRSLAAVDPDGLFISTAKRFYRDAPPEVRAACQGAPAAPMAADGPTDAERVKIEVAVRASAEMRRQASMARSTREARYVRQERTP